MMIGAGLCSHFSIWAATVSAKPIFVEVDVSPLERLSFRLLIASLKLGFLNGFSLAFLIICARARFLFGSDPACDVSHQQQEFDIFPACLSYRWYRTGFPHCAQQQLFALVPLSCSVTTEGAEPPSAAQGRRLRLQLRVKFI
jgi:hypothetical protein